jgi:erythromycin esterase-like protein
MKHRLFRCMVEELGFTLFAMECNLTEAERLDRYVLTGEGDPAALLRSMGFWTWNTQEVLDLLRWMRAHNATARVPVRFLGFDMLGAAAPMDSLVLFAHRSDPDGFPAVSESLRVVALTHELERRGPVGTAGAFLRGDPLVEKRLRLHGWIRTEAIENGEAALWIRADVDSGRAAFAGMEGAGPAGTSGWSRYAVELVVPPRARRIAFGALLRGEGAAWFDSLGLDVDGRATRPGSLYDFGFEDARPLGGLRLSGLGYRADADTSGARFGRKSLRLRQDPVAVAGDRSIRWTRAIGAARSVLARLEAESLALVARAPDGDVARALGEARLVLQSCEAGRNPPVRDRAMADNVAWLLEHAPEGARIALWAHNAHVSRRPRAMGSYLARRYGADYTNIALAFHQGTYTASDIGGPHAYDAVPSQPGSLEWALHRSGIPILALDLRDASPADSASAWLTGTPEFRSIGALPVGHGFYRTPVAREFDAVLFFDRAGASRLLPREGSP